MPTRPTGRPRGRPRHEGLLTPAEERVLELLRAGRTNPEIAAALDLSPETVKTHVARMLSKLGLRDRHELAAWTPPQPPEQRRGLVVPVLALVRRPIAALRGHGRVVATLAFGSVAVALAVLAFAVARPSGTPSPTPAAPSATAPRAAATPIAAPTVAPIVATVQAIVTPPGTVPRRPVGPFDFLDADRGWMWSQPLLLRTEDGGRTWSELARVPRNVTSVSFASADLGWLAGARGLERTTDGAVRGGPPEATAPATSMPSNSSMRRTGLPRPF